MKKERIESFDFMRSVTAWIIVIYHFACICNTTPQYGNFPLFYTHANGVWGENTSVNIFFMLSGASLYYNYSSLKFSSLKTYYWGRFKGLFPMFYMLWFFLFYQKAVTGGTLFYNGSPKTMLLTLCGMDGYLSYRYPQNYYFIGEWFLGALVCLYLLYPVHEALQDLNDASARRRNARTALADALFYDPAGTQPDRLPVCILARNAFYRIPQLSFA